jgi:hypothetical protein
MHNAAGIRLGLAVDFPGLELPAVGDDRLDDALSIQVDGGNGIIAGNNPRSVLLGVYRYLCALGCRWVRPGADGEYLPSVNLSSTAVHLVETPSYRHRALDLAGALSREWLLEVVDWCPKVGLSGVFLEYDTCKGVCNLWYSHRMNPLKSPEPFTPEQAETIRQELMAAVRQRDLIYHSKGHGWVYEALGLTSAEFKNPLPPELAQHVMLTDGERKVKGAGNTNLCYGNPETRRRFIRRVAEYAGEHPEADLLHVWLADGHNNHCECELCAPHRPADLYLRLMNELDTELTARNLDMRIVFLFYVDLLWPPETETIARPARFTLMFAPFCRNYNVSFADFPVATELPELPPYRRNKLHFSRETEDNVDFVYHWMRVPHADAFDFDYQYWLWQFDDFSGMHRARVEHGDIQRLAELGMNGLVGCYTLRAFYPMGLGMAAMAQTLWHRELSFDALIEDYFPAAFGPEWRLCLEYLRALADLCEPNFIKGNVPLPDPPMGELLDRVPAVIDAFRPVIDRNGALDNPCWAASWRYLGYHAEITRLFTRAMAARAHGREEEAIRLFEETHLLACKHEDEVFPVLDTWLFSVYIDECIHPEKKVVE